jgi:cysteine desulfurase
VSEAALAAMLPFFTEHFGNPSATYSYGLEAKNALEEARRTIAAAIGAYNNEIYFTSGGTEADNWALHSVCELAAAAGFKKGRHIISTKIEHSAILRTLEKLAAAGFEVTLLDPDKNGRVTVAALEAALRDDTILVSIMAANNVVGTLQPVKALCAAAHKKGALFHTDAVQAAGHIPLNVRDWGADLLSMSAHKFHGPKGTGALFARIPLVPPPYLTGGGQEKGRRSGTENVAAAVGMATALAESVHSLAENSRQTAALRDRLITGILTIPGATLTGDPVNRLPGLASFVFEGLHGQRLIAALDEKGICASSGSACSAAAVEAPHVLLAMGYEPQLARGALRLSLSPCNTEAETAIILKELPLIVAQLRSC